MAIEKRNFFYFCQSKNEIHIQRRLKTKRINSFTINRIFSEVFGIIARYLLKTCTLPIFFSTAAAAFSVKHKTIVPILRIIILRYRLAAFPPTINGTFCEKKSIFQAEISKKAAIKTRFVSCRRTVFFRLGGYPINCP